MGAFPDLEWRVVWLNPANAVPLRIRVLDPIPAATTYVDGSVTCVARGQSTVARCDFDAATNQLVYDGTSGADPGATTEEQAANEVVITFRTTVLPGVTQVANQALAHWDATGNGTVDDDISAGQVPVRTGTAFGRSDPTVATFPRLACLFQQRLLALARRGQRSAPTPGGSTDSCPAGWAGCRRSTQAWIGRVRRGRGRLDARAPRSTVTRWPAPPSPSPPCRCRSAGPWCRSPTEIRIANGAPADTLDLVENVGSKTERVPAREAHDVVTADGVVVEFPATALAAADTLRLERVDPHDGPGAAAGRRGQSPGGADAGQWPAPPSAARSRSVCPYPDADQDGLVDGTSPALPELTLTAWVFDAASQRWVRLPEARVLTAFNELRVATTQTGLYGVFQAADGSTGLAGTSGPAVPGPPVRHRAGQWLAGHRCGDDLSVPGALEYHDAAEWHLRGAGRLCDHSRGTACGGRECPHDVDGAPDERRGWGWGV